MTTVVEYRCPQCNHHIFNSVYAGEPNSPPANATGPGLAAPTGDVSRDGNTCPKCGGNKSSGFEVCLDCNKVNIDTCPQCGGNKQKQYPTCYKCSQGSQGSNQGSTPENAGNSFDSVSNEEEEDDPF